MNFARRLMDFAYGSLQAPARWTSLAYGSLRAPRPKAAAGLARARAVPLL